MKLSSFFIVCVLSACAVTTVWAQGVSSQVTVIHAGKLVDSDAGKVLTDQIIVIRDGKITGVGPVHGIGGGEYSGWRKGN